MVQKGQKIKQNRGDTLCWKCKNAVNGCCWAKKFEPVPGWVAEPTKIKYLVSENAVHSITELDSFKVIKCPEFESDFDLARMKAWQELIRSVYS